MHYVKCQVIVLCKTVNTLGEKFHLLVNLSSRAGKEQGFNDFPKLFARAELIHVVRNNHSCQTSIVINCLVLMNVIFCKEWRHNCTVLQSFVGPLQAVHKYITGFLHLKQNKFFFFKVLKTFNVFQVKYQACYKQKWDG